jgi:hypothetical protein
MEHELFQSKLKPSVDGTLLSDIVRGSSSGKHPHRAAAMELVFERSIQGRRERVSTKVKDSLQSDPTPQLKRSEQLKAPIPPAELPIPVLASPPPPQSSANANANVLAGHTSPSPTTHEVSPVLSTFSKPAKKIKKAVQREEPQADAKMNPPPSEDIVQLACRSCGVRQQRSHLRLGVCCGLCLGPSAIMKCVGCGTFRINDIEACTSCHKKFV